MSKTVFRFKQFEVSQEKSAMKIGTDGVLLGAWAGIENSQYVLDIGTGTGLISLMLAQRFPLAKIWGLEIDENAANEANLNFENSPFAPRLNLVHDSIQNFHSDEKFDFIISNPPFFDFTHPENSARNTARQQTDLTLKELLIHTNRLLNSNGKAAFILPFDKEEEFLEDAKSLDFFPDRMTRVKGNENSPIKRSLLVISKSEKEPILDELIIEIDRNVYTQDYIDLTRDFYLKM
jgi:tRNA1Val (adenine37-N6)-methyltransferase